MEGIPSSISVYSSTMLSFLSRRCWRVISGGRGCRGRELLVWGEDIWDGFAQSPAQNVPVCQQPHSPCTALPQPSWYRLLQASCPHWHPHSLCSFSASPLHIHIPCLVFRGPPHNAAVSQASCTECPTPLHTCISTTAALLPSLRPGGLLLVCPRTDDQRNQ